MRIWVGLAAGCSAFQSRRGTKLPDPRHMWKPTVIFLRGAACGSPIIVPERRLLQRHLFESCPRLDVHSRATVLQLLGFPPHQPCNDSLQRFLLRSPETCHPCQRLSSVHAPRVILGCAVSYDHPKVDREQGSPKLMPVVSNVCSVKATTRFLKILFNFCYLES